MLRVAGSVRWSVERREDPKSRLGDGSEVVEQAVRMDGRVDQW